MGKWIALIVFIGVCFAAAGFGAIFTRTALTDWYPTLHKPSWNPPNWIFGPVWTALYLMMAIAGWMVWLDREVHPVAMALTFFALQLILNASWTAIFFGLRNPGAAFVEIVVLWLAIVATILLFAQIRSAAAWMLVPYIAWVTFAASLNFTIWRLNR
ncbi:MAG: tryptophan-rich sensory protein [Deltaproteobacteria bacterium]|nr:tryptophan-rich sensory protein [Deltaproteobacteria bacterium]